MTTLTICVTVDWEGEHLQDANLNAMTMFRRQFSDIPLTHFLCPAYLTRGGDPQAISDRIKGHIKARDEVGLHIHCWISLLRAAGVRHLLSPNWYTEGVGPVVGGLNDVGHGVPLSAYAIEDIEQIIDCGRSLLRKYILNNSAAPVTSFRCGGWMAADNVQSALKAQKFLIDSSSTDAPYFLLLRQYLLEQCGCELGGWLNDVWGRAEKLAPDYLANSKTFAAQPEGGGRATQPYDIDGVLQMPDNGVLADYLDEDLIYERLMEAWAACSNRDIVHVCGFHQESAMGGNIYGSRPNIFVFMKAIERFLGAVTPSVPRSIPGQDDTQKTSILIPSEQLVTQDARKLLFKTIRDASNLPIGTSGMGIDRVPPLQSSMSLGQRHFG